MPHLPPSPSLPLPPSPSLALAEVKVMFRPPPEVNCSSQQDLFVPIKATGLRAAR